MDAGWPWSFAGVILGALAMGAFLTSRCRWRSEQYPQLPQLPFPFDRDAVQCPLCGTWHEQTGLDGILRHIIQEHPDSALAHQLRRVSSQHGAVAAVAALAVFGAIGV